jgi:hypothetical protein
MNDGGGLIQFEGLSRYANNGVGSYPGHLDRGPANRYAAGNFMFSAATLPIPPYAADYAALIAGVTNFPTEDTKHLGSIAVINAVHLHKVKQAFQTVQISTGADHSTNVYLRRIHNFALDMNWLPWPILAHGGTANLAAHVYGGRANTVV